MIDSPKIAERVRTGDGFGWHEHVHDVHEGCERFFRPGYNAHLVAEWLPALRGGREARARRDGLPTSAAGTEPRPFSWPKHSRTSTFDGSDYHAEVDPDRERAGAGGGRR